MNTVTVHAAAHQRTLHVCHMHKMSSNFVQTNYLHRGAVWPHLTSHRNSLQVNIAPPLP